jgi:putative sigma-54 modulation protein
MEIVITGRHMRVTAALKKYIEERVLKTEKYLSRPFHITFILKAEKYRQIVEARLTVNGIVLTAEAETEEMHAAVEQVMMKLERQLKKYKEKVSSHRIRKSVAKKVPALKGKGEAGDVSRPSRMRKGSEAGTRAASAHADGLIPSLMDRETVLMEVLTLGAALMQMESKKQDFLFFRDRANRQCYFLHKKDNGRLGLVELRDGA